ncbi:hypothetical protein [Halorhodospira halochloris]|uniref:hypothetical protein n=1 Tax=Halorhodospira halochloris TaxID=1052 RepID=UPI0013A5339F|nr:hypothetical protein [Halorhodospira halochloris]
MEDAVNPSLDASWRHPWRQDLHAGAAKWLPESFRGAYKVQFSFRTFPKDNGCCLCA